MNIKELNIILNNWRPEVLFASEQGVQLIMKIDGLNSKINWIVKWVQYGYDCSKDFYEDNQSAFEYFIDKVNSND